MDEDAESESRLCKTCGIGVLSTSEPERFKNCMACRSRIRERKTSSSSSFATTRSSNATPKSAKTVHKLQGKAKKAAVTSTTPIRTVKKPMRFAYTSCASGSMVRKPIGKGKRVQTFVSEGELYGELRSEAIEAHDERYLLEFNGCFESVVNVKNVDYKVRVGEVVEELVGIGLLREEYVTQGRPYSKVDGSMYSAVYECSCQPRDECCGQIKVTAETVEVFEGGVGACQRTSVRVYHR